MAESLLPKCGVDIGLPDDELAELSEDAARRFDAEVERRADELNALPQDKQGVIFSEIRNAADTAAIVAKKRAAARNSVAANKRQMNLNDIARQGTIEGKYRAAMAIIQGRADLGSSTAAVRHSDMLYRAHGLQSEFDEVLMRHLSVLENSASMMRITDAMLGFGKADALPPKERAAFDDLVKAQEDSRKMVNKAIGDPDYLEYRKNYMPHDISSVRLINTQADDNGEQAFVDFMLPRLKGRWWGVEEGKLLRNAFREMTAQPDNAVPATAFTNYPGHREFEFVSGEAYWEFINKYNGANNLNELYTRHLGQRARNIAATEYLGKDVDKAISQIISSLREADVPDKWRNKFRDTANYALGRYSQAPKGELIPSQMATTANGAITAMNALAMAHSVLTLPLSIARTWIRAAELDGGLSALRIPFRTLQAVAQVAASGAGNQMAKAVQGAMYIPQMRAASRLRESIPHIVEGGEVDYGARAGDRLGRAMKTISRKGGLGLQGYFHMSDFLRNVQGAMDNIMVANIFEKGGKGGRAWVELSDTEQKSLLRHGKIDKDAYEAAREAYWNGGGRQAGFWGTAFDYGRIDDKFIANKFGARARGLADDSAGIGSALFHANVEAGSAGSWKRAGATLATGLSKDPAVGTMVFMEAVQNMWNTAGWQGKATAIGAVPAFVLLNMQYADLRSQMIHIIKYGEPHDRAEREGAEYYEQLLYLYGLELLAPIAVTGGYYIDNESALLGGSPAYQNTIGITREALWELPVDLAFGTGDSDVLEFLESRDRDKWWKAGGRFLHHIAPVPGALKDNVYNTLRPDRTSAFERLTK